MVRIKINNIEFLVNSKLSVLEACQLVGIHVPRFCYHETLSIAGNCRMCLVEIEKAPKPVASCALPISNNLSIYTDSPLVKKARENILEALLLNHPLDCPICDQGGECDLQDQTKIFGGDYSRYYVNKRVVESKPYGSFIKTIMTRCIHCTRCVRFSDEIAGTSSFGTFNRGKSTEIGGYITNIFDSEISGNVVDLCPVGALTLKPYAFKSRPWELKYQETIDCTSSLGTPILINIKESEIVRIQPKVDSELENLVIPDKIRFSYDSLKKNRIQKIFKKVSVGKYKNLDWKDFNEVASSMLKNNKVTFIVNENVDLNTLQVLNTLNTKIVSITNTFKTTLYDNSFFDKTCDLSKKINTCILIATNLKLETTLLNTKLRLKYNKSIFNTFSTGLFYKSNFSVSFINLSSLNIIKLLEGKLKVAYTLVKNSNTLLILGNSILKRISQVNMIIKLFRVIIPTAIIINNQINSNSVGINFFGINRINTNTVKNTDIFFCIDLEDCILARQILKDKKVIWCNTHGSNLALNADYILPTATFLEKDANYLNLDGALKKTHKVLSGFQNAKTSTEILDPFIKNTNYNILSKVSNINFNKFKNNQSCILSETTFVQKFPIKTSIENHYMNSVFTKNSTLLSKRVQEQNSKNSINF